MFSFKKGPADNRMLLLNRAPKFLRVTWDGKEFDGLDGIEQDPKPGAQISVYERIGKPGQVLMDFPEWAKKKNSTLKSQHLMTAEYLFYPIQPDDSTCRIWESWKRWCTEEMKK